MDLLSIIVPVYNTAEYLDACVGSIVGQTYKELEIILVDDGSTDGSPALCDAWAEKDPRIRVIHKENGGLSSARNAGMAAASGKYFGFVDSDDVVSCRMFEIMLSLAEEHKADIAQCGYVSFSDRSAFIFDKKAPGETFEFDAHAAVESLLVDGRVDVICWNKLVNRSIACIVPFEEGRINEDVLWTYRVIEKAVKTAVTSEPLYGYYQRPGSIMNSRYTEKRFDGIYALGQRAREIKLAFPDLYPLAERNYAGGCMYHYQWLCRLPDSDEYRGYRKRLHGLFCASDLKAVYSVAGLKYRVWYTMFRLMPALTCKLRNLLKIGL